MSQWNFFPLALFLLYAPKARGGFNTQFQKFFKKIFRKFGVFICIFRLMAYCNDVTENEVN